MKVCLTLAVAFISGAVVSFLVTQYGRQVDERRMEADERRRLVGELREVHHAVTTAKLRINAHRTVRTYGMEIRDVIIPKISQLGGVLSDVNARGGGLSKNDAEKIAQQVGVAKCYLEALTKEYEEKYLAASLLQEADYKWRQHRVAELVKERRFSKEPPAEDDLPERAKNDSSAWSYLNSQESGRYRFPRLRIFLELELGDEYLAENKKIPDKHAEGFSKPVRHAMDNIDQANTAQDARNEVANG
jgi:hypothetical protein